MPRFSWSWFLPLRVANLPLPQKSEKPSTIETADDIYNSGSLKKNFIILCTSLLGVDFYNVIQIVTIIALGARFPWLWFPPLRIANLTLPQKSEKPSTIATTNDIYNSGSLKKSDYSTLSHWCQLAILLYYMWTYRWAFGMVLCCASLSWVLVWVLWL